MKHANPLSGILKRPTRHLFFTGKGGVGKTSLACAVAISLSDKGSKVLLVSTDPASNLDEMLQTRLGAAPTPIPGATNLFAMNIDPEAAADSYRQRVLDQLEPGTRDDERQEVREQLSGSCTTEIAAFDEFVGLLAGDETGFDHIVFDTAPTGHTLRLLSLPKAWTGFLKDNDRGASCLGPHSGLKMQESRFNVALKALGDPKRTTIVMVTRPDAGAVREAARASAELRELGISNQHLVVNGVFRAAADGDPVAAAIESLGDRVLTQMPDTLAALPQDRVPLRSFDMIGVTALRALLSGEPPASDATGTPSLEPLGLSGLAELVDELAASDRGLVMVMGKGGVGKTTVAAAIAVGLAQRKKSVHLSTTDPAAHVATAVGAGIEGLTVDRIDPKAETDRYIAKVMDSRKGDLDPEGLALLREDLNSPCTEEVAVFHAFSRIVAEARSAFVVLDTAPTGHTLLLMDATGAYHRQMVRDLDTHAPGRIVTPLMRLQDPDYTKVILVTLPETTPVSEASALQDDLRRAKIEPYAWVINRTLTTSGTTDPLLLARLPMESAQTERLRRGLAKRVFDLPWQAVPPVGIEALSNLVAPGTEDEHTPAAAHSV